MLTVPGPVRARLAAAAATALLGVASLLAPPPASANPLAGAKFYVDPFSDARRQADAWSATRPADAAELEKIASRSQADWFGGWSGDIITAVNQRVTTIRPAGALPVLVAYNIPQRDCGGYSEGGAGSPAAYRTWIRGFAGAIGDGAAVVILEPDALAGMDCLSSADRDARVALINDAIDVLEAQPNVAVYVDAGHSHWQSAAEIATRLTQAGVSRAQGFSLNVSNYNATADEVAYARSVSARVGGKHAVIDTSRNGLGPGPDRQWCNPPGRAVGAPASASTAHPSVDAYLWIKRPGESDGTCNGGPPAGAWWPEYALGLTQGDAPPATSGAPSLPTPAVAPPPAPQGPASLAGGASAARPGGVPEKQARESLVRVAGRGRPHPADRQLSTLTAGAARRLARRAAARERSGVDYRARCHRRSRIRFACSVRWKSGGTGYHARLDVRYRRQGRRVIWEYRGILLSSRSSRSP
jgi:endoglucanase